MVRSAKIMEIIEEDGLCAKAAETGAYLQNGLQILQQKTW
jgi:L-lysine 6-transaminase